MSNGIYISAVGATTQLKDLDVSATNIANASTPAYHAERMSFGEVLASQDSHYAVADKISIDNSSGTFTRTDNPLDLAIAGEGYFSVQTPNGIRYTRAGNFTLDKDRNIVNATGYPVLNTYNKKITIPRDSSSISISPEGLVSSNGQLPNDITDIANLSVVNFPKTALSHEGGTLYKAEGNPQKFAPGKEPQIMSGQTENSNFNLLQGVSNMVRITRTYEALHRMIETNKELDDRIAKSGSR